MKCRGVKVQITSVLSEERMEGGQGDGLLTANLLYLKNELRGKSFHFSFKIKECVIICHCAEFFRQARGPPELQTHIVSFK